MREHHGVIETVMVIGHALGESAGILARRCYWNVPLLPEKLIHGFRQVIRDEEGGGTGRLAEGVSRGSDPRIAERAVSDVASPRGHLETLMPGERLFRDLYRRLVDDMHTVRLKALRLAHHRVHDARHFYAVRAVRAATPYELVARQLGPPDISKWWLECTASTHRGAMSATDGRRSPQTRTPHAKHSTRKKSRRWVPLCVPHLRNDASQPR